MSGLSRSWWILAALVGVLAGVGFFTFGYAEGLSYFSADPEACKNCHIMNEEFDSWQKAGHHGYTQCVDCHLPAGFVGKYLAKAENGYHHSRGFTLQDFHEPVRIKEKNARILQENCLRCHGELVHELVASATSGKGGVLCTHCHVHVGHGPVR